MVGRSNILTIRERKIEMASIIKRKKSYSVVYNYVDENGETKQKWETWHTYSGEVSVTLPEEFHLRSATKLIGNGPLETISDTITLSNYETVAFLLTK